MDNKQIGNYISMFVDFVLKTKKPILNKVASVAADQVAKPVSVVQVEIPLDWNNHKSKISKYFTVSDAIILREWDRLANADDGLNDTVKANLIEIFRKMDIIREFLGVPVYIKSAYRPSAYNIAIGGAKQSAHMAAIGYAAVDFWCDADGDGDKDGDDCDVIKAKLMPMLEQWGLRMEDNGKNARWVHMDNKPVAAGGNRFFKP